MEPTMEKLILEIEEIIPQQHFLSDEKLRSALASFETYESIGDIFVIRYLDKWFSIDGHHRLLHLYRQGVKRVEVCHDPADDDHFLYRRLAKESLNIGLKTIADLEDRILTNEDFLVDWVGKCQLMLKEHSTPEDNMRFFMSHHEALFDYENKNNHVFVGYSDRPWTYLSVDSEKGLCELLEQVPKVYSNFALIEDWMVKFIDPTDIRVRELICERLYLPASVEVQGDMSAVEELTLQDAHAIQNAHAYGEYTDIDYVKKQIDYGYHGGIRVDGELVAWALTHDDGAIGFLYVMPDHRGKHFGEQITAFIVKRMREDGLPVYVHIEKENLPSIRLAEKMGFVIDRTVRWFSLVSDKT
ncbi:GNAT family N-acetyltransferase [Fusibacter sp. A1]|nr:GNAT family N-acetyltransferase [Fusibacter sp. A1]